MPEYRRARTPGATYFFTVNTHLRQPFLIDADVRAALREGIDRVRLTMPFQIDAWVLLPDHIHCIWTLPDGDADFSSRWRIIKTIVTQRCGPRLNVPKMLSDRRKQKNQSSLWQHRFWEHQIRDEEDWRRHIDYIFFNPVKHGYVSQVRDWQFSSFENAVGKGWYDLTWGSSEPESIHGMDLE